jgi:hypothetical protein
MPPENIYEVENQRQQESVNSGNNNAEEHLEVPLRLLLTLCHLKN